jgi:hypothetical protein
MAATKGLRVEKRKDADGVLREVEFHEGGVSLFKDTGEAYDEKTIAALAAIGLDAKSGLNFEGQHKQNVEINFWRPEILDEKTDKLVSNPIRGYVLGFFQRPANFGKKDAQGNLVDPERKQLVCWMLTSTPTYITDRNKKTKLLPARNVAWVDVNQAFSGITLRAAPLMVDGVVEEVYEVAINPKSKRNIGDGPDGKPRQAWQMELFGGRGPIAKKDGYRTLDKSVLKALMTVIQVPEITSIKVDEYPEIDAGILAVADEVAAGGHAALPAHGDTIAATPSN